jgi:hypothetical protein
MPIIQGVQKLYWRTMNFKWRVNKAFSRVTEPLLREKGPAHQWRRGCISDPESTTHTQRYNIFFNFAWSRPKIIIYSKTFVSEIWTEKWAKYGAFYFKPNIVSNGKNAWTWTRILAQKVAEATVNCCAEEVWNWEPVQHWGHANTLSIGEWKYLTHNLGSQKTVGATWGKRTLSLCDSNRENLDFIVIASTKSLAFHFRDCAVGWKTLRTKVIL